MLLPKETDHAGCVVDSCRRGVRKGKPGRALLGSLTALQPLLQWSGGRERFARAQGAVRLPLPAGRGWPRSTYIPTNLWAAPTPRQAPRKNGAAWTSSPQPSHEEASDLLRLRSPVNRWTCCTAPAPGQPSRPFPAGPESRLPPRPGPSSPAPRPTPRLPAQCFWPGAAPAGHVPLQRHDFASHAGHGAAVRSPRQAPASPRPQRRQRLAVARPGPGEGRRGRRPQVGSGRRPAPPVSADTG